MQNTNTPPKLPDQVRDRIRVKHYIICTETVYATFVCCASVEADCDIRPVQGLLGHRDVFTTMIYTHVLNKRRQGCIESALTRAITP